jgi:hypothetical protein
MVQGRPKENLEVSINNSESFTLVSFQFEEVVDGLCQ